jgi:hypothetical protein
MSSQAHPDPPTRDDPTQYSTMILQRLVWPSSTAPSLPFPESTHILRMSTPRLHAYLASPHRRSRSPYTPCTLILHLRRAIFTSHALLPCMYPVPIASQAYLHAHVKMRACTVCCCDVMQVRPLLPMQKVCSTLELAPATPRACQHRSDFSHRYSETLPSVPMEQDS